MLDIANIIELKDEYKVKYMSTQNEEIKAVYQSIIEDLEEIIDDYKEFTVPF